MTQQTKSAFIGRIFKKLKDAKKYARKKGCRIAKAGGWGCRGRVLISPIDRIYRKSIIKNMKIIDWLNDKNFNMSSNVLTSTELYLEYNVGEGMVVLKDNNDFEEWFELEDFKKFVKELQDFSEALELKLS